MTRLIKYYKSRPVYSKLIFWLITTIVLLAIISQLFFFMYKDGIKDYAVDYLNTIQNGTFEITSLSLSFIKFFPNVAIGLEDVVLYSAEKPNSAFAHHTIMQVNTFYFVFDIIALLTGKLDVAELNLENGHLHVISSASGQNNLFDIIEVESEDRQTVVEERKSLALQLNSFSLRNIELRFIDELQELSIAVQIHSLENVLTLNNNIFDIKLNPSIEIIEITKGEYRFLPGTQVQMNLDFVLDLDSMKGVFSQSSLQVEGADLHLTGMFDLTTDYMYDLKIKSELNNPSLLFLLFNKEIIEYNFRNLQKGRIFFDGYFKGSNKADYIDSEFKFGVSDLDLDIPGTDRYLYDISFNGFFSAGAKADLSEMTLKLSDIHALGKAGRSTAAIEFRNSASPEIEYNVDLNLELTSFERLVKWIKLPVFSGNLAVQAQGLATYDAQSNSLKQLGGGFSAILSDVSFMMSAAGKKCDELSGRISWANNRILIDSLNMKAGNSDLQLKAEVSNLFSTFLGYRSQIDAKTSVIANEFRLTDFFTSDDIADWLLDEEFKNVKAELSFSTDNSIFFNDWFLPPGKLLLHNLRAEFKNVAALNVGGGSVHIDNEGLQFDTIRARIGTSPVSFSGSIQNFVDLFSNDFQDSSAIGLQLYSPQLTLADVFTYKNVNYMFAGWQKNTYKNFSIDAVLIFPPDNKLSTVTDEILAVKINQLDATNVAIGSRLNDVSADIGYFEKDLRINSISGKFGKTIIDSANVELKGVFADDIPMSLDIDLKSNLLDLGELFSFGFIRDSLQEETFENGSSLTVAAMDTISVPRLDINADISLLVYKDVSIQNIECQLTNHAYSELYIDLADSSWWYPGMDISGRFNSDTMTTAYFKVPETNNTFSTKAGIITILPTYRGMFGAEGGGNIKLDLRSKIHNYHLRYSLKNYNIANLLNRFEQGQNMSGTVGFEVELGMSKDDLSTLNGELNIYGEDLVVQNIDIDEILARFERTQKFNLVDISAFMLAGPAGAMLTKASDYAVLLNIQPGKKSYISGFISHWNIEKGKFMVNDVAFTTRKSRIALGGGIDFYEGEFVDFTLAVVDEKGCVLISQKISGKLADPQFESPSTVSTILAPITNVFKMITGSGCEPFYTGSLKHPE